MLLSIYRARKYISIRQVVFIFCRGGRGWDFRIHNGYQSSIYPIAILLLTLSDILPDPSFPNGSRLNSTYLEKRSKGGDTMVAMEVYKDESEQLLKYQKKKFRPRTQELDRY